VAVVASTVGRTAGATAKTSAGVEGNDTVVRIVTARKLSRGGGAVGSEVMPDGRHGE